jgi:flagellar basal body-associated protein FliL
MESKMEPSQKNRYKRKVIFLLPSFLLILGLALLGHTLLEKEKHHGVALPISPETPLRAKLLNFDDFLIPLEGESKHALIALSFSLQMPNEEIEKAVEERMKELRGCIYDTLREDFENREEIPSVQAVKDGIGRAMGLVLPELQVKDVYIRRFLAL